MEWIFQHHHFTERTGRLIQNRSEYIFQSAIDGPNHRHSVDNFFAGANEPAAQEVSGEGSDHGHGHRDNDQPQPRNSERQGGFLGDQVYCQTIYKSYEPPHQEQRNQDGPGDYQPSNEVVPQSTNQMAIVMVRGVGLSHFGRSLWWDVPA
jgi:hypothetical protein